MTKSLISIVVPVYNEEENIASFYAALGAVLESLSHRYVFEIVFTDNHSTDATVRELELLVHADSRVRFIRFSRNFGYQRSIYTGYLNAKGEAAIQLDVDLQDPPDLIPVFLEHWEKGYEVVYGVRATRKESWGINFTRKCFYRFIDFLSDDKLPYDAGDFRLVGRRVLNELAEIDDSQPYLRGTIAALGFEQIGVPYHRHERIRGQSKFSMAALVGLAFDGILNHSIVPLRISTFVGLTISVLTFLGMCGYLLGRLVFGQSWPAGFATLTILILFSVSLNAVFLGIIGEYLGRIYQQVKKRKMTVIEREVSASVISPRARCD
jgi:polyisoprenyl-phosphate glycosyltransferase